MNEYKEVGRRNIKAGLGSQELAFMLSTTPASCLSYKILSVKLKRQHAPFCIFSSTDLHHHTIISEQAVSVEKGTEVAGLN